MGLLQWLNLKLINQKIQRAQIHICSVSPLLEYRFFTSGFVYILLKQIEDLFFIQKCIDKHFKQILTARHNFYIYILSNLDAPTCQTSQRYSIHKYREMYWSRKWWIVCLNTQRTLQIDKRIKKLIQINKWNTGTIAGCFNSMVAIWHTNQYNREKETKRKAFCESIVSGVCVCEHGMCVLVNWVKQGEPAEEEMNTGDWGAFNAMDQHTPDVLLALSDTGRKGLREEKEERKSDEEGRERERRSEQREGRQRKIPIGERQTKERGRWEIKVLKYYVKHCCAILSPVMSERKWTDLFIVSGSSSVAMWMCRWLDGSVYTHFGGNPWMKLCYNCFIHDLGLPGRKQVDYPSHHGFSKVIMHGA